MPDVQITIKVAGKVVSEKSQALQGTFNDLELAVEKIYRESCQVTLQATANELARTRPLFALNRAAVRAIEAMPSVRLSGFLVR